MLIGPESTTFKILFKKYPFLKNNSNISYLSFITKNRTIDFLIQNKE